MADCIFCHILSGNAPVSFVYSDDVVAAFMDIQPVNLGHLLIVPKRHAPLMADVTADEAAAMMQVAQRATVALRASTLKCEGVNYFLADGEAAMRRPPRQELDQQAAELRALLPA